MIILTIILISVIIVSAIMSLITYNYNIKSKINWCRVSAWVTILATGILPWCWIIYGIIKFINRL